MARSRRQGRVPAAGDEIVASGLAVRRNLHLDRALSVKGWRLGRTAWNVLVELKSKPCHLELNLPTLAKVESPQLTMQTEPTDKPGIDILNTGYGDVELRFDADSPADVEKAKQTITDMLKQGYAIFVEHDGKTKRVRKFDVDKNVYIIGSTPAEEVSVTQTKATAVGRSAGG
jgi:hypothetical protein